MATAIGWSDSSGITLRNWDDESRALRLTGLDATIEAASLYNERIGLTDCSTSGRHTQKSS
jgi:hypothetical protein